MFEKIVLILGVLACIIALALVWTQGIDDMNNNHPDYKGEDFLN